MQCFQKDHNLRVSARKLLKHPWIVNARRSDSVVPKKSTEYEEAVKSVQQWNEALKSPNATLRKASRPVAASPVPQRRERPPSLAAPPRSSLTLTKPRAIAEQFRSPDNTSDDNWDDDFASAISPSALQLPHLKPQDHFGGLLSAEKLKSFASFETVTEEANWDDNFEGELTVKSPIQIASSNPLRTIRPYFPEQSDKDEIKNIAPVKSPKRRTTQALAPPKTRPGSMTQSKRTRTDDPKQSRPTLQYRENSIEDYSDLIVANDSAFDARLALGQVSRQHESALYAQVLI